MRLRSFARKAIWQERESNPHHLAYETSKQPLLNPAMYGTESQECGALYPPVHQNIQPTPALNIQSSME